MTRTQNVGFERTIDGLELRIEAVVMPGRPGKYYGKPEDCYPDEPAEVEEVAVYFEGEEVKGKLGEYLARQIQDEEVFEHFEPECAEDYL